MSTLKKLRKIFAAFTLTSLIASLFVVAPVTQAAPPSWWTEGTDLLDQVADVFGDENQVEADKCRVAAVLTVALGLEEQPEAAASYTDVPEECAGVAGAMISAGIIMGEGNDGQTFGAGVQINRAVFATMLSRAFNLDATYPDATLSAAAEAELEFADWAKPAFAQVMAAGIYKQIRPADTINIYEITTAVSRAVNGPSENTGGTGGDLEVTISDNTPDAATVPGGVQNAHIATFELSAGEDDVNVTSLKFTKGGIADDDALTSIALFTEAGNRISRARSFNSSDDQATVNILGGGLTIEAGESMDLLVIGEIGSVLANSDLIFDQFYIEVKSSADVASNASSVSVKNAKSNTMTIGSADAAELELSSGSNSPDVSIGERGVEVYQFDMENNSTDNTEIIFYGITLEAEGSFDEDTDLMNYELYLDGDLVASTEEAVNGYVSFLVSDEDGYVITDGKTVEAEVRADVMSGAGDTISFGIDSALDVLAADASFGTGAKIAGNITGNTTNIEAGELTLVAIDVENDEFTQDTDEYVLGTIRVTSNAGESIELQELAVDIISNLNDVNGAVANGDRVSDVLENVEAVTPFGTYSLDRDGAAGATEKFEDDQIDIMLPAGETFDIVIQADILDNLTGLQATDTLQLALPTINGTQNVSYFYAEETDDDQPVTDITPSSLSFDSVNGAVASLEIRALTQSNKTVVVGTDDVVAMHFELEAGKTEDITVNDIEVSLANGAPATANNQTVSALRIYKESVSNETLLDSQSGSKLSGGAVTFDNLDTVIPAGETVEFYVLIDTVDNQALSGGTLAMSVISVDAEDEDNDDINTITLPAASTRLITLAGVGSLTVTADNSDPVSNRNKLVLAGSTSDFVASFELNAVDEDILIRDLELEQVGPAAALTDGVATVVLYGNDKVTEIARESVTSDTVLFEDINYTVEVGSENIYAKVITHPYGKDKAGTESAFGALGTPVDDYQFEMTVTDLKGVSSGNTLVNPAASGNANGFAISAVKLNNVSFVDSYDGTSIATSLVEGENIVAILKLENAAHSNSTQLNGIKLETLLNEFTLDIQTNTTINNVFVERLDRNADGKVGLGAGVGGDFVTLDTTSGGPLYGALASDNEIESGETAYYAISFLVDLDPVSDADEFVKVFMDNFRTASAANDNTHSSIVYSSDEGAGAAVVDTARIQATRVEAKQLNESN